MIKKLLIGLLLFSNVSFAQTQKDLNIQAENVYVAIRSKLDSICVQIALKSDTCVINNLILSNRAWEHYRDCQVRMLYPDCSDYGSSQSMCRFLYLTELTCNRIIDLRPWLEGEEEGDICNGTIPTKK